MLARFLIFFGCLVFAPSVLAQVPKLPETKAEEIPFKLAEGTDFGTSWETAKQKLKDDYSSLFEQEVRVLDSEVDNAILELASGYLSLIWERPVWTNVVHYTPILLIILLLIALAWGLDRAIFGYLWRKQAVIKIHGIDWVNNLTRASIVLGARLAPVLVIWGLILFPIQPLFSHAKWTQALGAIALPWLIFRALQACVVGLFGFRLVRVADESARKIAEPVLWLVRVGFWGTALQRIAVALEWPSVIADWLAFVSFFGVALTFLAVARIRDEVVELLGGAPDSKYGASIRHRVRRYFYPAVAATVLLFVLAAFGFGRASSFILFRAYGAIFIISAAARMGVWLQERVKDRVAKAESRDESELFSSIGSMLRLVAYFTMVVLALKLLMFWDPLITLLSVDLFRLGKVGLTLVDLIDASVVVMLAILAGKVLRALLITTVFPKLGIEVGVSYAVNTLLSYTFFVVGVLVALVILGVDFTSLTVVLAALGVGIGLGLQSLTENLVSGFILLFGRSVKKGDVVTVNNVYGRVEDVGARSVVVRTPDNVDMLIPSKNLVNGEVINWSYRDPTIRVHVPVGVSYACKPREIEEILLDAAKEHPQVQKEPAPEVWLVGFGDSSVNFELLVYIDLRFITQRKLIGQLNYIIWDKLTAAHVEIPFPQRDINLRNSEALEKLVRAMTNEDGRKD